jgi:hypothetical protein
VVLFDFAVNEGVQEVRVATNRLEYVSQGLAHFVEVNGLNHVVVRDGHNDFHILFEQELLNKKTLAKCLRVTRFAAIHTSFKRSNAGTRSLSFLLNLDSIMLGPKAMGKNSGGPGFFFNKTASWLPPTLLRRFKNTTKTTTPPASTRAPGMNKRYSSKFTGASGH